MLTETVSYSTAFIAGILTFFSPCILPLIPAYFSSITGMSLDELTHEDNKALRKKVVMSTLAYIMGFSVIFILMGASASFLGRLIYDYSHYIRIVGGVIIILFGLHLTGIIPIKYLYSEKRFHFDVKNLHLFGAFLIGMAFAAGWSPCIGPILGSILMIASYQEKVWNGIFLLGLFSIGLAIPFIVMSLFINSMLKMIQKAKMAMKFFNVTAGVLLVVIGVLLLLNKLTILAPQM